jgi:DNA-binding CsgD family transcriptional regulator
VRQGVGEPSIYPVVQFELDALAQAGRTERLAHVVQALERMPSRPWTRAVAARGQSLLAAAQGDLEAARERMQAAAAYEAQPFEHARTLLALGRLERRAKRKRAARDALEAARDAFAALPAPLWEAMARGELARVGVRRASGELTETESRIATLAASGMSNPEIAAAVFVSRKTVEANLSKTYRKLGVRSRVELAARLARRELPD